MKATIREEVVTMTRNLKDLNLMATLTTVGDLSTTPRVMAPLEQPSLKEKEPHTNLTVDQMKD